jgi:hypothetical protein
VTLHRVTYVLDGIVYEWFRFARDPESAVADAARVLAAEWPGADITDVYAVTLTDAEAENVRKGRPFRAIGGRS